jgi:hypothetical protein
MTSNTKKPNYLGLHVYRLRPEQGNPEEKRFADAWSALNEERIGRPASILAWLLHEGDQPGYGAKDPTDREHTVAATVVQWLGSHVGQCFLRDLGYEKQEKKR